MLVCNLKKAGHVCLQKSNSSDYRWKKKATKWRGKLQNTFWYYKRFRELSSLQLRLQSSCTNTFGRHSTLYFLHIATISGSWQSSPSILYIPSTTTIIFFQGLCVLGCPSAMCSLRTFSKWDGAAEMRQRTPKLYISKKLREPNAFFNETESHTDLLLCWKTRIVAPDPRAPLTMELWFRESLIIKPPCQHPKNMRCTKP